MQLAQTNNSLMNLPVIPEIRKIINEGLTHDWILRVEHNGGAGSENNQWQEWGKSAYAIYEASPVIDKIAACHSCPTSGNHNRTKPLISEPFDF